jgi:hypothetical protein
VETSSGPLNQDVTSLRVWRGDRQNDSQLRYKNMGRFECRSLAGLDKSIANRPLAVTSTLYCLV